MHTSPLPLVSLELPRLMTLAVGGKVDAPVVQRIFWATIEGVVAAALLFGGGADALTALQAAAITVGLPFTVVLIAKCLCLYMGLSHEKTYVIEDLDAK
jgi:BCCT family betaine/carnitine transporter